VSGIVIVKHYNTVMREVSVWGDNLEWNFSEVVLRLNG